MGFFSKLIGNSNKRNKPNAQNEFMPETKSPIDERFTINFKNNGGKFLYCENVDEILKNFDAILDENKWQNENLLLLDDRLKNVFKGFDLKTTSNISDGHYFLSTCEFLVADDGSILISSNQIAQKKLKELPNSFIVYATTSQLVENISEGLKGIKIKSQGKIPTNISTIKHFKVTEETNFLTYGCSSKNLYLLLLEDL